MAKKISTQMRRELVAAISARLRCTAKLQWLTETAPSTRS